MDSFELTFYYYFLLGMIFIGLVVFIILFFVTAGYGQHYKKEKWGSAVNDRVGWVIMEIPTVIVYIVLYFMGNYHFEFFTILFSSLFLMHYGYRTFIFPMLIRGKNKMPITIIIFGMMFNTANAYLQGRWINTLYKYQINHLINPFFIIGISIFVIGFSIHAHSDHIIRNLRKPGENEFKIPKGGMFKYVSCPSYLGEITEWCGWWLMTLSLSGFVFFLWTFFNLSPRARSNHKWYLTTFPEYPENRKALIPFIY
ncbi:MAG: 3-oxo-5-alpha-steroid 4-dehydrogenase [Promethearchaeota archaeon]|nr:MAG: 3-oxo-5-alpha-steroid 4-dehydrogenase [Candidatus Lokiarchaeota archaeon]